MKNKIVLSMIVSGIIASSSFAQEYVTQSELEDTISEMQETIDTMNQDNQEFQGDYTELENLVEELETNSLKDKFNWSGDFKGRMDSFSYKNNITRNTPVPVGGESLAHNRGELNPDGSAPSGTSGESFDKKWKPHYNFRLRLNMTTEIIDDMKFTGRFVISKNTDNNERICILSRNITASSYVKKMAFDIDRAYIDYSFNKEGDIPLIFSAGILPTTGGPSANMKEGVKRKSVFPSIIFDANLIGGILSANLSKVTGLDGTWARFIGGKAYTLNDDQFYYQCNREDVLNMDVAGAFLETKLPWDGFKDSTAYIGASYLGNLKLRPYLGSSSAGMDIKHAKSTGSVINLASGVEIKSIKGSNFDIFAHIAMSIPNGNDETISFPDFSTDTYASGGMISENGYSLFVGSKYTVTSWNDAQFGIEYNKGSKYWFSATQGSEDVFNKLATRGYVYEAYYTQPFNDDLNARIGVFEIDEAYTGSGWHFGEPAKKDAEQLNIYVEVNARF